MPEFLLERIRKVAEQYVELCHFNTFVWAHMYLHGQALDVCDIMQ